MYRSLVERLASGKDLSKAEIQTFLEGSISGKFSDVQQATVLSALNTKGVSARELEQCVRFLSKQMPHTVRFPDAIDICGTGGSGLPRINTSTISAFILSALGVPVAKHGNKAASGRFGSFDLLEALDIQIDIEAPLLEKLASRHGLAFLYARSFHPIMKHFGPVRRAMGVPTIFNLIGPLLNPAHTQLQIIGTAFSDKMMTIAETAQRLGKKRMMIVRGEDGLDEITLTGKTDVIELINGKLKKSRIRPAHFGVAPCSFADIQGGTPKKNTAIALSILKGICTTRHLDLVLINAAAALKLAGKVRSYKKGYAMAKDCVMSGKAYQQYLMYRQSSHTPSVLLDITEQKKRDIALRKKKFSLSKIKKGLKDSDRSFRAALEKRGVSLIAEIKKASPSAGVLKKGRFDVVGFAKNYERAGASALSVLTDQHFFGGSLENLKKARLAAPSLPILCKDFIIDSYQIYEARKYGADAVLLIAAILTDQEIEVFLQIARSLSMDCLVEVHNKEELSRVLKTDADIIGINNRNLHTFEIDMKTTQKLAKMIKGRVVVAESGIGARKDITALPKNVDAILVGTSLVKSKDPKKKIAQLIGPPKPLLRICGVQTVKEALLCQQLKVDLIGLNFVPTSRRRISYQAAAKIVAALRKKSGVTKVTGVFMDQPEDEVFSVAQQLGLDYIQLHGDEALRVVKASPLPVIKAFSVESKKDIRRAEKYFPHVAYILFDGRQPGSGDPFPYAVLKGCPFPFLLAGGINKTNALQALKKTGAIGVDSASGVETNWKRDHKKIVELVHLLS